MTTDSNATHSESARKTNRSHWWLACWAVLLSLGLACLIYGLASGSMAYQSNSAGQIAASQPLQHHGLFRTCVTSQLTGLSTCDETSWNDMGNPLWKAGTALLVVS